MNVLLRAAVALPRSSLSLSRCLATRVREAPQTTDAIETPADFLKAIGRSCETKLTVEDWDEFWQQHNGAKLKAAGVNVRDRRYITWCMEKYRSGLPVDAFAHEPSPKKTIRGWGPSVQNGKRIRSRRERNKTKRKNSS